MANYRFMCGVCVSGYGPYLAAGPSWYVRGLIRLRAATAFCGWIKKSSPPAAASSARRILAASARSNVALKLTFPLCAFSDSSKADGKPRESIMAGDGCRCCGGGEECNSSSMYILLCSSSESESEENPFMRSPLPPLRTCGSSRSEDALEEPLSWDFRERSRSDSPAPVGHGRMACLSCFRLCACNCADDVNTYRHPEEQAGKKNLSGSFWKTNFNAARKFFKTVELSKKQICLIKKNFNKKIKFKTNEDPTQKKIWWLSLGFLINCRMKILKKKHFRWICQKKRSKFEKKAEKFSLMKKLFSLVFFLACFFDSCKSSILSWEKTHL